MAGLPEMVLSALGESTLPSELKSRSSLSRTVPLARRACSKSSSVRERRLLAEDDEDAAAVEPARPAPAAGWRLGGTVAGL
jgi:hypothetical protein